ncbi:hypothetical protein DICA3_E07074 [Diutina catenulata]
MISHRCLDKTCRSVYRRVVSDYRRRRRPIPVENTVPGLFLRKRLEKSGVAMEMTHVASAQESEVVAALENMERLSGGDAAEPSEVPGESPGPAHGIDREPESSSRVRSPPTADKTPVSQSMSRTLLSRFVTSITGKTVTEACHALAQLTEIPGFVLCDILARTPLSADEFEMQIDIWTRYADVIVAELPQERVRAAVNNLVYYGTGFWELDSREFLGFITFTIDALTGKFNQLDNGAFQAISPVYTAQQAVNGLMWETVVSFYSRFLHHRRQSGALVAVFEAMVQKLPSPGTDLTLEGLASIVVAVYSQSPTKAQSIWARHPQYLPDPSRIVSVVNLFICSSPESLMDCFNQLIGSGKSSSLLWLVFIRKLDELGLLTEQRSLLVVEQLAKHHDDTLITKNIVLATLRPVKSYRGFVRYCHCLDQHQLVPQFESVLVPRLLSYLYHHRKNPGPPERFAWDPEQWDGGYKGFESAVDYARWLYRRLPVKTMSAVGEYLQGESYVAPERVYELYCSEIRVGMTPNALCLSALIRSASKHPYEWSARPDQTPLYAPQIAVYEFKRHVASARVSQPIWQRYIALLAQYNYTDELASVIQWWERLKFVPNPRTLLVLLQNLPQEHAFRLIDHYNKVKRDSEKVPPPKRTPNDTLHWPWPSKLSLQESTSH